MKLLSSARHGTNVRKALERAAAELNGALASCQGRITKLDADIHSGISGATARLVVAVDESDLRPKCILWANEAGDSEGAAFRRAQEKINIQLAKLRGEIAGFYSKVIAPPLPKRTYVTLIVAVNEEVPEEISELDSSERRERLAALLRLLGNDTRAINLARIAKIFGVSRDTVYKDLEKLGAKR